MPGSRERGRERERKVNGNQENISCIWKFTFRYIYACSRSSCLQFVFLMNHSKGAAFRVPRES
jgi:hypothetical protein